MLGTFKRSDRFEEDRDQAIDVLMLTLDADAYLERCLDSLYQYIPVKRLIVCDGGSQDNTEAIINSYPRTNFHRRPDIRTTGKGYEFLFSLCETEWFALIDSDVEIVPGWFDEMNKYRGLYDFYECKRIISYNFFREEPATTDPEARSYSGCQMGRKKAFENYHCDDDYIWRTADLYAHQHVVKSGFTYGKVPTTYHYHHTGEGERYKSDAEKAGTGFIFKDPEYKVLKNNAWKEMMLKHAKAVVKYLDPDFLDYKNNAQWVNYVDKKYIQEKNPKWLEYYSKHFTLKQRIKDVLFIFYFPLKYLWKLPKEYSKAVKERKNSLYRL